MAHIIAFLLALVSTVVSMNAQAIERNTVIYGAIPPLFGASPLRDLTTRLDAIQELGASAIWLSPIHATDDDGAISYAITDFLALRADFGSMQDFQVLVRAAHARGMQVMLDFVPNHTATGHAYYKHAQAHGKKSPYYDFYDRNARGEITHYFDWEHLPNLNYNNPALASAMRDAFKYWVLQGVDGFRIDVAWGIRERSPAFWPSLIRELRTLNPNLIMLAEASARDPYYFANGFDLAYDWTDKLGEWAWKEAFETPARAGEILHRALTLRATNPSRVIRFLNNNDTGARFITRYGEAMTRLSSVFQLTVPGVPLIYMGDEVGAEYEPYDDPAPLTWDDPHALRAHYLKLLRLRQSIPALSSGDWLPIIPERNRSAYAFFRFIEKKSEALVVLNFGNATTVDLEIPARFRSRFASGQPLEDHLSNQLLQVTCVKSGAGTTTLRIPMKKVSAAVLTARSPTARGPQRESATDCQRATQEPSGCCISSNL